MRAIYGVFVFIVATFFSVGFALHPYQQGQTIDSNKFGTGQGVSPTAYSSTPELQTLYSLNNVFATNSNIDLVAGSNITLLPDYVNSRITISAAGGGTGGIYTGIAPIDVNNDSNTISLNAHIPTEQDIDNNALAVINSLDLNHSLGYLIAGSSIWALLMPNDFNALYLNAAETDPTFYQKFTAVFDGNFFALFKPAFDNNLFAAFKTLFDSNFAGKTTSDLSEGTNKYYTDARARAAISANSPISYNSTTGVISVNSKDLNDIIDQNVSADFVKKSAFPLIDANITNLDYSKLLNTPTAFPYANPIPDGNISSSTNWNAAYTHSTQTGNPHGTTYSQTGLTLPLADANLSSLDWSKLLNKPTAFPYATPIPDSNISSATAWNAKAGAGSCTAGNYVSATTTSGVTCTALPAETDPLSLHLTDANKAGFLDANSIKDWNKDSSLKYASIADPPDISGLAKTSDVNAELAKKAYTTDVNGALDKKLNTADLNNASSISPNAIAGGVGGGSGWQLVSRTTTSGSLLQDFTFSDLNGNADEVYYLVATIKQTEAGGTGYNLKINGDGTAGNYDHIDTYSTGTSISVATVNNARPTFNNGAVSQDDQLFIFFTLHATAGFNRSYTSKNLSMLSNQTIGETYDFTGIWENTTDNVTSITIHCDGNKIGIGSEFMLYKGG